MELNTIPSHQHYTDHATNIMPIDQCTGILGSARQRGDVSYPQMSTIRHTSPHYMTRVQ